MKGVQGFTKTLDGSVKDFSGWEKVAFLVSQKKRDEVDDDVLVSRHRGFALGVGS